MDSKSLISLMNEKANENSTLYYSVKQHYIYITEDKLRLLLNDYKSMMESSKSWVGYFFGFSGFGLSLYMAYIQLNEIIKFISIIFASFMFLFYN